MVICVGFVLALASGGPACGAPGVPRVSVVLQGRACARLVIAGDASPAARAAAALLADYVARSAGARLEVGQEPPPADGLVEIHCGATTYVQGLALDVAGLNEDGYLIAFPDARHVVLLGAGDSGQEHAACEFLQRYVGVRWLFPGAPGEVVPTRPDLTLAPTPVRDEPRIVDRLLRGIDNLTGPHGDCPSAAPGPRCAGGPHATACVSPSVAQPASSSQSSPTCAARWLPASEGEPVSAWCKQRSRCCGRSRVTRRRNCRCRWSSACAATP